MQNIEFKNPLTVKITDPQGHVSESVIHNGLTDEGRNHLLSATLAGGTQAASWHMGLISSDSYTAVDTLDTANSHAGWVEEENYSSPLRPQWSPTVSNKKATNTVQVDFTASADLDLQGVFVQSSETKGGTNGVLWATALFDAVKSITSGSTISIIYSVEVL